MQVRLPNGKIISGIPEGTSKEAIQAKAIASGIASESDFLPDSAQSTALAAPQTQEPGSLTQAQYASPRAKKAAEISEQRSTRATRELPELPMSGLLAGEDKAKIAAISPVLVSTTDPQEIADILKSNFPNVGIQYDEKGNIIAANNETGARAVINKPGVTGMDVIQAIGIGAAFTPAGRVGSVAGAAGASALTEGAMQGAQYAAGGEFDAEDILLSGGLGAAGKALENVVSGGIRAASGEMAPDAAAVIAAGERANIPVMTTDVIQPETAAGKIARYTGEVVPFAGTGGQRKAQQAARQAATDDIVSSAIPQYSEVVESLKRQTQKVKQAAGNRLDDIASQMDEFGGVTPSQAVKEIDRVIADLTAPNRVPDETTVKKLQEYKQALEVGQDFRSLDTLRSDFREQVKGDRISLPTRTDAAVSSIYDAMTRDLKGSISSRLGADAARKWTAAKGVYANEAIKIKRSRLKNVMDKGDITPEQAGNLIFSNKPSEVRAIYQSLDAKGKEAMRGTIIAKAVERATNAEGVVTPNALATQLGKLRGQIGVAFPGIKGKELQGFADLMNATRRAQDAAVVTPTGQTLTGVLGGYAAFTDLATTAGAGVSAGMFARAYESRAVRNALLRIANTPKGSVKYDAAISEAIKLITAAGQGVKNTEAAQ